MTFIRRYPTVATTFKAPSDPEKGPEFPQRLLTNVAMILAGTPFFRKSTLDKYSWPRSSSWVALFVTVRDTRVSLRGGYAHAVWFGNPDTGIPIPVEQISPVKKMSRLA